MMNRRTPLKLIGEVFTIRTPPNPLSTDPDGRDTTYKVIDHVMAVTSCGERLSEKLDVLSITAVPVARWEVREETHKVMVPIYVDDDPLVS